MKHEGEIQNQPRTTLKRSNLSATGLMRELYFDHLRIYNLFRTQQVSIHIGIEKVKLPILILQSSHTIFQN